MKNRRFRTRQLLLAIGLIAVVIALVSPKIRHRMQHQRVLQQVVEEFDHASIRDSGRELLEIAQRENLTGVIIVDPAKLPASIRETNPRQVRIFEQVLTIEYDCNFILLVVPPDHENPLGTMLLEGIAYHERVYQ